MTPAGKALKEAYQWEAKSQWKGKPLQGDISVSITLYFGTKRKADLDNFNKLSLNALSGIAYEDDSQIAELHLSRGYDKARPRIEVIVSQN
jgi:Holliday junction resolvase RusA-like endonuclease